MENILWDDVVFKLRKTRQKTCSLLDAIGRRSCSRWRDWVYKNRRLGKSRGVRFDSRLVRSVRCDTLWAWNGRSVFLLALLSVGTLTLPLFCMHRSGWLLWRQRRIFSPLSPSPLLLRVTIKEKKKSVSPHHSQFIQANVRQPFQVPLDSAFDRLKKNSSRPSRRRGITAAEGHHGHGAIQSSRLASWPRQRCTKSPTLRQLAE